MSGNSSQHSQLGSNGDASSPPSGDLDIEKPMPPGSATSKKKAKEESEFVKKWGRDAYNLGWTAMPNLVIERQQALQLDALGLNIVLIFLKHWWRADDDDPFPSKQTLADITGRSTSSVQRKIRELEQKGLVKRQERFAQHLGQMSNGYSLEGLIEKVKVLARQEVKDRKEREKTEGRKRRARKIAKVS